MEGGGGGGGHLFTGYWVREGLGVGKGGGGGRRVGGALGGGGGGLQHYGPRGRSGLQVPILVRRRPRARAETSGKAIGWNRPPREDWSTI